MCLFAVSAVKPFLHRFLLRLQHIELQISIMTKIDLSELRCLMEGLILNNFRLLIFTVKIFFGKQQMCIYHELSFIIQFNFRNRCR